MDHPRPEPFPLDLPESTPALVIDEVRLERNLQRMADYARKHGLKLRPHTKTHKSLHLARRQLELGAAGLTVAKVGEARVMAGASDDLLIAYPAFDPYRARAIAELALAHTIRVALDSPQGIEAIGQAAQGVGATVGVLVDLDVGYHRTGVPSPEAAVALAQQARRVRGVRFDGLFCYPGHIRGPAETQAEPLAVAAAVAALLEETCERLRAAGLEPGIVSGGSTPTAYQSHRVPQLTEIRPGTYAFNDMNTVRGGYCELEDCAARVVCTVVSNAVAGKVVIDAGSKTLTSDLNAIDPAAGFGRVVEHSRARIARLSEEHGEIAVAACPQPPRLGERLSIIPNHICPCVNLLDRAWRWRRGALEPLTIDTRGQLA